MPWALPRQDFQPGVPWHVAGSLLGLDIALAPLNLRRLTIDRIADAPKLSSIEREALAVSVALLDPQRLKDADRDAIADAIGRGRDRVDRWSRARAARAVADALGFDGWRRRGSRGRSRTRPDRRWRSSSRWSICWRSAAAPDGDLDAWGTSAIHSDGCACTQMPSAEPGGCSKGGRNCR